MTQRQGGQPGQPTLKQRIGTRVEAARGRPLVDHAVRVVQRYGEVKGNLQAGAMTFFGFLSFFPLMLMAFTIVGWVSKVYPQSQGDLVRLVQEVFPGIIGRDEGQIRMSAIEDAAAVTGPIAFVGILYAGLGWVAAMRDALVLVFEVERKPPNFLVTKLRDLAVLAVVGTVLLLSVAVSGFLSWFARQFLDLLSLGSELAPAVVLFSLVLGIAASTLFFFLIFKLLTRPPVPDRSLAKGALVGALGFEVLKRLSSLLIAGTEGRPAFQAFGIVLILLVWINYFSRVVVLAACWAWTTREARGVREQQGRTEQSMRELARVEMREAPLVPVSQPDRRHLGGAFAGGAASMLALVALVRRRGSTD